MTAPEKLSRPIAERVVGLPAPAQPAAAPTVPEAAIEAAVAALAAGKTHYTDRPGILGLRQWVADHLQTRYSVTLSPDAVTITCGATEARYVALKRLVPVGQTILAPDTPDWLQGVGHLIGANVVTEFSAGANIALAYLPAATEAEKRAAILEAARQQNCWLVWDGDAADNFHPAQDTAFAPRVVTVGSLSAQIPGWRIGWLAGSELAGKLRAYKQSMTICTPSVSQWGALGIVGGDS